jgi:hypothetical protein
MYQTERSHGDMRRAGALILAGSGLQLIAAMLPNMRVFTSPDPLERLRAIETNKRGWMSQAVLFPVGFGVVTTGFGALSRAMRGTTRVLALLSTLLSALSVALWLPISIGRLRVGADVDDIIHRYKPGSDVDLAAGNGWAFWPYTHMTLASISMMAFAIRSGGLLPKTGAAVLASSGLSQLLIVLRWRDWPPLVSYLFTGTIGMGLLLRKETPGVTERVAAMDSHVGVGSPVCACTPETRVYHR